MFKQKFNKYVCDGDTITTEAEGFEIIARIERDDDYHIDDDDSHNIDTNVTGCNPYQQKKLLAARKAWKNDEWFYCGVVLSVSKNGVMLDDHAASLWAIEANYPSGRNPNKYLTDVANELLPEAIEAGKAILTKLTS